MAEFIVTVEDRKSRFLYSLLKDLDYVQVKRKKKQISAEDRRILDGIEQAVREVNLYKQGKIELQDAREMIEEVCQELIAEGYSL